MADNYWEDKAAIKRAKEIQKLLKAQGSGYAISDRKKYNKIMRGVKFDY